MYSVPVGAVALASTGIGPAKKRLRLLEIARHRSVRGPGHDACDRSEARDRAAGRDSRYAAQSRPDRPREHLMTNTFYSPSGTTASSCPLVAKPTLCDAWRPRVGGIERPRGAGSGIDSDARRARRGRERADRAVAVARAPPSERPRLRRL